MGGRIIKQSNWKIKICKLLKSAAGLLDRGRLTLEDG
jgi:hypothetical protein